MRWPFGDLRNQRRVLRLAGRRLYLAGLMSGRVPAGRDFAGWGCSSIGGVSLMPASISRGGALGKPDSDMLA